MIRIVIEREQHFYISIIVETSTCVFARWLENPVTIADRPL